ncbi:unnamed protein product [Linum trigynum]|uniref:Uncharacterized protein n=1 Tax=Linum trigynum TaxID=586398 RepID=A0AAV2E6T3_9ROSI
MTTERRECTTVSYTIGVAEYTALLKIENTTNDLLAPESSDAASPFQFTRFPWPKYRNALTSFIDAKKIYSSSTSPFLSPSDLKEVLGVASYFIPFSLSLSLLI